MLREEAWQLYIYTLIFCWLQINIVRSQEDCIDKDPCKCTFKNGSDVDLSSLGKTDSTPRFKDVVSIDGNYYSYNPCYGFTEGSKCTDSAVCLTYPNQKLNAELAKQTDGTIHYDSENNKFILQYLNPSVGAVVVTLVCDPDSSDPLFRADGLIMEGLYQLTLTSRCACIDGCKGHGPEQPRRGSFSPGTLLCIMWNNLYAIPSESSWTGHGSKCRFLENYTGLNKGRCRLYFWTMLSSLELYTHLSFHITLRVHCRYMYILFQNVY